MKYLLGILSIISTIFFSCNNGADGSKKETDSVTTTDETKKGADSITAYDEKDKVVRVRLTPEMKAALGNVSNPECLDSFPVRAINTHILLPDPGRPVTLHDITNSSSFTVGAHGSSLAACVSGQWNPRYFNPRATMTVYYGRCFSISQGAIRACRTAYGWRVEGDREQDGSFEGILKIIIQ